MKFGPLTKFQKLHIYTLSIPRAVQIELIFAILADFFFSKSNGFLAGSEGRLPPKNEVDTFNIFKIFC